MERDNLGPPVVPGGDETSLGYRAVSEERLGYSERHADKAPRGQVPGHLVSTPPFVSPLCPLFCVLNVFFGFACVRSHVR
jgi:hypothetical protein